MSSTDWLPVTEKHESLNVLQKRTLSVEFQIKNNPFVKKAPTVREFKIIEKSEHKMHFRNVSKSHDVPYCDSFHVEEDWIVVGGGPNSCAIRIC